MNMLKYKMSTFKILHILCQSAYYIIKSSIFNIKIRCRDS